MQVAVAAVSIVVIAAEAEAPKVETTHLCQWWWQLTRCQRRARSSGGCPGCVDVTTDDHRAVYAQAIAQF